MYCRIIVALVFYSLVISTNAISLVSFQKYSGKVLSYSQTVTEIMSLVKTTKLYDPQNYDISKDVQFMFYNRLVPDGHLIKSPQHLKTLHFHQKAPTKFIIHGWMSGGNLTICQSIKNRYLQGSAANVFIVHWERIAYSLLYPIILQRIVSVADYYAHFLEKFIAMYHINPRSIHLIGHSVGAHISGMAGKRLQLNNITIGRITGLDPALPGFENSSNSKKLSQGDAAFVDVIHTSGGTLGVPDPIGHTDFYPNGGMTPMPGCEETILNDLCSHSRSWQYFAESISNPFLAVRCDTFESFLKGNCTQQSVEIGERIPLNTRGTYYFYTNWAPPYSMGRNGLRSEYSFRRK